MNQAMIDKTSFFAEQVHVLLNTSFSYLDRSLAIADCLDYTLVPQAMRTSYDDFFFGGILFNCERPYAWEICTAFQVRFCALQLENSDGFAVIGPYLPENGLGAPLEEILIKNGVPPEEAKVYTPYFNRLPMVSSDKLAIMLGWLTRELYGSPFPPKLRALAITAKEPSPCPVFPEDSLRVKAEAIARRYNNENMFLERITHGESMDFMSLGGLQLERLPNKLRNQKNLLIVLNTLMRKAIEAAKVHPLYIDEISAKWAVKIEELPALSQVLPTCQSMADDYARIVRQHSLANYTSNVRQTINCINFNLSNSELTMKKIAEELGVNANYLSLQFNREVGCSFPEFITGRRMEEAKKLLVNTSLSIGRISEAVGYSDLNYFTKRFSKLVGLTPTAYRQKQLDR